MPMPRLMARLNRVGVNRLLRHVAPRTPGLGVVVHRGRRSGRCVFTTWVPGREPSAAGGR